MATSVAPGPRTRRCFPEDLQSALTDMVAGSGLCLMAVWLEGGNVLVDITGLGAFQVARYDGDNVMARMRQEVKDLADVIVLHASWRWEKERGALRQEAIGRAG